MRERASRQGHDTIIVWVIQSCKASHLHQMVLFKIYPVSLSHSLGGKMAVRTTTVMESSNLALNTQGEEKVRPQSKNPESPECTLYAGHQD